MRIEKCSESIGIILVLYFLASFFIRFHPQIIDSLFAIKIFFENLMILIVGSKPAIPGIAEIVISFLIKLKSSKLLQIFIFFLLNFECAFLNMVSAYPNNQSIAQLS